METHPLSRDLVLVGGGHANALVLRAWGMRPLPGARLTLIDPSPTAPYTGMLPGHVAGHYPREALEIDLVPLARFAGARLVMARATGLDLAGRRIRMEGRPDIAFDVASIDVGITSAMPDLPGFAEHAVAAKPLGAFADRWRAFLAAPEGDVAVIGGGVAGCELALAMAHALREAGSAARVTVIEAGAVLRDLTPPARRRVREAMAGHGIAVREDARVEAVTSQGVRLAGPDPTPPDPRARDGGPSGEGPDGPGRPRGDATVPASKVGLLPAALVVGAAGARPWPWLAETGLETVEGYLAVGPDLATSDPSVFAAGDCAHLTHAPRPKAGVFAVRAAPVLHRNLRAALAGGRRRAFRPQARYLKLVSLGGRRAVANRSRLAPSWLAPSDSMWALKDRIDRAFMRRLTELPAMPEPPAPRERAEGAPEGMLCGGCGAKVGGDTLAAALAALPEPRRADVLSRPGDDAAVLGVGGASLVATIDHLRAFTEDPWLLARIAAIHAMGDVWAMGAEPQAGLASIVLPRMGERMQAETLREVLDALSGALREAGAELVGGHTTMGAETTIGVAVTGLPRGAPIGLAGARPGDALILTEPLGTGTILAAEMQRRARGPDVAECLRVMGRAQGAAARILRGARAMTDVTGFGLAGHLAGICRASGVGARIDAAAVPLLPGALALAEAGVASTLAAQNRRSAGGALPDGPLGALLVDPQTAGGLLAAVPAGEAQALLRRLRDAGHEEAALVGETTDGPPRVTA
jgi:selenide,water dikinase